MSDHQDHVALRTVSQVCTDLDMPRARQDAARLRRLLDACANGLSATIR
jgi:hypothetical protein